MVSQAFGHSLAPTYGTNFSRGINFGNAGCTASFPASFVVPPQGRNPFALEIRIGEYRRVQKLVQSFLSCFILGGNDFNNYNLFYYSNQTAIEQILVPNILGVIKEGIQKLIKYGAMNFLIWGLTAQGCASINLAQATSLPFTTAGDYDQLGCSKRYNNPSIYYNQKLMDLVDEFRANYTD
ncbi:hypothetical protein SELMODRAFT_417534 [Selaginella moellendorffii]|uniref:Uncharacterized protein n=1 Tax=Selaginella moellendorffii TaxID=88036 RepID=D8S2S5_SELML|nr:hypothetical protein SELMODRAFT_417534 [Selaginella moellendorffii]